MTYKARVRGIYSTALTKLLLDNGFEAVQPSPAIRDRLRLEENVKSPDLDVYDKHNRQGVHVIGSASALEALKTILRGRFVDVILRKQRFITDGIYKGVVKEESATSSFVTIDLGPVVGKLPKSEISAGKPSSILIQIQRKHILGQPLLSTKISIPGEHAVLIPDEKIKVSLKIRDMQKRTSLIDLGKKIAPSGWGIIWRTTSASQSPEVLESEVHRLSKTREDILKSAEEEGAPALLWGDHYHMDVEFAAFSKAVLDEIRGEVAPTILGHHYYKACGRTVSAALEMAEAMLEESGVSKDEAERRFQETIEAEYPYEGSFVSIEHVKPYGKVYHLGRARVEKFSDGELAYSRVFKNEGFYDSLGTPKEPGDRAVTEARVGDWHYTTRYFSKDGSYKGAHVNLNTPLELYPRWVRYVDLEIDISVLPDGTARIVDEDELGKAVAEGFISERLAAKVKEEVSKILETLSH